MYGRREEDREAGTGEKAAGECKEEGVSEEEAEDRDKQEGVWDTETRKEGARRTGSKQRVMRGRLKTEGTEREATRGGKKASQELLELLSVSLEI